MLLGILIGSLALLTTSQSGFAQEALEPESALAIADQRPNIVFFVTDDLDTNLMSQLPALQKQLEADAVTFENAYVSDPFCCPSRASILTGLYAHNHGIYNNSGKNGGAVAFQEKRLERKTIAYRLQQSGYETSLVGKYFNGATTRIPEGWSDWHGWVGDLHAGSFKVNNNGDVDECRPENCHNTDYLADRGVEFINRSSGPGSPFFLYMSVNTPHDPDPEFVAPRYKNEFPRLTLKKTPSFNEQDVSDKPKWVRTHQKGFTRSYIASLDENQRNYARGMLSVEDAYGRLVKTLKENGEYDNTLIVFTSDHGKFKGDHGLGVGKRTPYEHDVRVPMYVKGVGVKPHRETRLTSNVDYYATFAELAGLPGETDGRSIVPLLEGRSVAWRKRVFVEGYAEASVNAPHPVPTFTSVVEQNQNYVRYGTGEREYYDLRRDPYQLVNKASKNVKPAKRVPAREIERMQKFVKPFQKCDAAECRAVEDR